MKSEEIKYISSQINELAIQENFIGIGSTRKVYKYKNFVIKKYLHPIGYQQSLNEQEMYQILKEKGLAGHITPILYIDEKIMIQPYFKQLPLENGCTYDLKIQDDIRLTDDLKQALNIIDTDLDGFDFLDSSNFGLNEDGELILIDYGMTKKLYEEEWVPLAEAGILPQIYFEKCTVCREEKELRIYGKDDTDRRCIDCGKE